MDVEGGVRTQCLAICERGDEQDFSVKGKRVTATGDGVAFEFDELFESHEYDPESLFESLLGPTEVSDFSLSPASSPLVRFVEDVQPLCILLLGSKSIGIEAESDYGRNRTLSGFKAPHLRPRPFKQVSNGDRFIARKILRKRGRT